MSCSAILVNFHGAADTAAAARSAIAGTPGLEVLVVDNSADDDEFNRLKLLLPSEVRLMRASHNLGFGRACNLAFNASESEFVFLVNPDVKILPGCISSLIETLQTDPLVGAVAPRQYLDDACQWRLPPSWFPTALRAWATEMALKDRVSASRLSHALRAESLRYWMASKAVTQRALSGGALLVRRSALGPTEELFDPRFFMYFEDSDLCSRLKRRGYRLAMLPSAVAIHRWRNQPHKATLMAEGAAVYFDKHRSATNRWQEKSARLAALPSLRPLLGESRVFPSAGLIVPKDWEDGGWLFELSPSPLLSPSIGRLGAGPQVGFPHEALSNFEGATVYGRLGPAINSRSQDNCWFFEFNVDAQFGEVCKK
ncbi:MAG: glycosyltransferase family 2 protein [Burkholderiales bacterium]|nr:glycosyltransferase family 2 protein [Burkholderiales bacterium]